MKIASKLTLTAIGGVLLPGVAAAQVPDLVAAFDAGGRALGMGGATSVTGSDTLSISKNPAGLGFANRPQIGLVVRNLPTSNTTVTGDIGPGGTKSFSSDGHAGTSGVSHAGIIIPLKRGDGSTNGAFGLSLTKIGFIDDETVAAPGTTENGVDASSFFQRLQNMTDLINFSYGRSSKDNTFNWGVGVVYAINHQAELREAPSAFTNFDDTASGWGYLAGVQFVPKENPNLSFGISFRSPITLHSHDDLALIYTKIPGDLAGGFAIRKDGLRRNKDFAVLGLDVHHYFGGDSNDVFERQSQTTLGIGGEYNYSLGNARIPVRVGYVWIPSGGGPDFGPRNTFTYGFGYRPASNDWALDLNFGRATDGARDMSLSLSYKFGN